MRKLIILITALTIILLGACNSESVPSSVIPPVIEEIASRDALAEKSIENGSEALFNAQGGVSIENGIFMFNQGVWKNGEEEIHIDHLGETTLTAIYPAYSSDKTLITHHPYDNDTLQDVLIAQSKFSNETNIQLKFRHLFSRLTVRVHSSKAKSIDAVRITAPKVTQIDSINGTMTTAGEHTTLFSKNEAGVYSCMIPSLIDCPLTITFALTSGNEVTRALTHTFVSGHKYECHVNRPGIRTAEDLIDFSRLINGYQTYYGKMLDDFGEKIGDETVYRLLADIELTESQCEKLYPIGNNSYSFNDIFDGEGHTISKLKIRAYDGYAGLFGYISENGCIRNLHSNDCYGIIKNSGSGTGILAGVCDGIINNCKVSNSTITNEGSSYTGAIAGLAYGRIMNCSVENTTIIATINPLGSIVGYLYNGKVFNSYAANDTIKNATGSTNARGGIAGYSLNGVIQNCYVYNNSYDNRKTNKGQFIGSANNTTVKNCYYDIPTSTLSLIKTQSNCTSKQNYQYDNKSFMSTINGAIIPVYTLLNQLITSDIYIGWKESSTLPAVFNN